MSDWYLYQKIRVQPTGVSVKKKNMYWIFSIILIFQSSILEN